MTKIKFKFHQKPLSDEQISSFKNFDSLMTAFVAAPKPSLQYRFIHNRFFIYTTGIMSGIIITSLVATLFFNQNASVKNQIAATDINQTKTKTVVQSEDRKNSTSITISLSKKVDLNQASEKINSVEANNTESEKNSVSKRSNSITNELKLTDAKNKNQSSKNLLSGSNKIASVNNSTSKSNEKELNSITSGIQAEKEKENLISDSEKSENEDSIFSKNTFEKKSFDIPLGGIGKITDETKSVKVENITEEVSIDNKQKSSPTTPVFISESSDTGSQNTTELDDSSKKKLQLLNTEMANKVVDISRDITDESKDSYQWMRAKLNGVFASRYHDKRQTTHDTVSNQNRAAQVSFLYPIGSNGIISGKYSNVFSFNILSGYNGGVNGFELGGLVNIDRKNMNGLQIAGLTNVVFGNANGLQLGGLVNHARNVNGAQIGGLVNTSLGSVDGTQIGGLVNYALDSINGAQISGIANVSTTSHSVNGTQIGGITNLSLGKMNGSQISGIVNVANKLNGFQIGLINVGVKVAGMQIGLINISDSLKGVPIGLISISRNGLFHVDVFNTDFSNINASVRLGSKAFYNIFSIGVSPNTTDGNRYSFGYGIGTHIDISKKFFTNIDAVAWNVHYNNFNDWSTGINMINQLRILPGWQITKGIGLYAGPCLNVEVLHDSYNSAVKSHLYSGHGGGTTGVNGWIGWTAGLQFF
ncbi:hypothetical protein LBMAG27_14270 [Bacteroidota bacterium]|nr:hypothetical protein LBMAG27_14270 [Bacteroidota bacterium]